MYIIWTAFSCWELVAASDTDKLEDNWQTGQPVLLFKIAQESCINSNESYMSEGSTVREYLFQHLKVHHTEAA